MKKQTLYVCDFCGTQYKEKAKAEDCEKNHTSPVEVKTSTYRAGLKYPTKIDVKMSDGTIATYRR